VTVCELRVALVHALCRPAAARAGSRKLRAAAEAVDTSRGGMNEHLIVMAARRWNWGGRRRTGTAAERLPVVGLCVTCDNVTVAQCVMRAIDYKRNGRRRGLGVLR
jgi:hypothetical protein